MCCSEAIHFNLICRTESLKSTWYIKSDFFSYYSLSFCLLPLVQVKEHGRPGNPSFIVKQCALRQFLPGRQPFPPPPNLIILSVQQDANFLRMLTVVMYYFRVNEYFMEIIEKYSSWIVFPTT